MAKIITKIDILSTIRTFSPNDDPVFIDFDEYVTSAQVVRSTIYNAKKKGMIDKRSKWEVRDRRLPKPGIEIFRYM